MCLSSFPQKSVYLGYFKGFLVFLDDFLVSFDCSGFSISSLSGVFELGCGFDNTD